MRYQTPQFINIEDKVFGPFSFRQFVYMGGGAGISYALWTLLPKLIAIPFIVAVAGFAIALAFYKVNNRPFALLVQSFLMYIIRDKLYLWKKVPKTKKIKSSAPEKTADEIANENTPRLSESRLKKLAWSLDVLDSEERDPKRTNVQPKQDN